MRPENITRVSSRKGERGNVLAYTVMSAFFLFMAVGLGVDLSHLYLAKTELQNAADAAALAGASALKDAVPDRIIISEARATQILNANKYNFNNRTFTASPTIEFAKNLNGTYEKIGDMDTTDKTNARFIRVTTPQVPITTFFAIPMLGFSTGLTATATAGLSVPGNVQACPTPLSALACNPASTATCNLCDPRDGPACTWSKYWGVCPGTDPYALQTVEVDGPDDPDGDGHCDPKKEFCKGCTYNIRAGAQEGQGPAPGVFLPLSCGGGGADAIRDALAGFNQDCPCQYSTGDVAMTQTGDLSGAIRQGLNVRFDVYGAGGLRYGPGMPPDTNIAQGGPHGQGNNQWWDGINWSQYQGTGSPPVTPVAPAAGHVGVANRRVLVVPLVNVDSVVDAGGHQQVTLRGLAGFFMRAQVSDGNGGDIQVEYISDDIIGVIGFDPNDSSVTNIVTPVLYR